MKRSKSFTIQKKNISTAKPKHLQSAQKPKTGQTSPSKRQDKNETVPQAIMKYIKKRSDVEIIVHYDQYKQQFFLKCKRLQDYLYKFPAIKQKYLTDDDNHFRNGFESLMLDLFRRGVIVPQSFDNLRMEAVVQLENWVLSWVQRKLLYQKAKQQQKEQIIKSCQVLNQLQQYVKIIEVEELPF